MFTLPFIITEEAQQIGKDYDISFIPTKGTPGSSASDLRAAIPGKVTIWPGQVVKLGTGIKIDLQTPSFVFDDFNITMVMLPRSSVPGLVLENTVGVIDTDYQGQIMVKYRNIGEAAVVIEPGERIAQALFVPTFDPNWTETTEFEVPSERGEGGFGSTGTK